MITKKERNTIQKNLILNLLKASHLHPTADEIYESVRSTIPNISKGTVYRNLKLMVEKNEIKQFWFQVMHYDGKKEDHAHFFCEKCGKIIDISVKTAPFKRITNEHIHQINTVEYFYTGICKDCNNK
jgi:Fur family transcriptional regulator, peroxide stress response regulator